MSTSSARNRLTEWLAAMRDFSRGIIVLKNLVFDWMQNRLPKDLIYTVLLAAARHWERTSPPHASIEKVADSEPDTYLCKATTSGIAGTVSRILDARDFVRFNTNFALHGEWLSDSVVWDRIEELSQPDALKSVARGEMSTRRPIAWVTRTTAINEKRQAAAGVPSAVERQKLTALTVRDGLGLSHYLDNILVEVVYPDSTIEKMSFAAPTFIEGGQGLVYRSAGGRDGWGRALDLATNKEGMPESVHRAIPFTGEFGVRMIGKLPEAGWKVTWEDEAPPPLDPIEQEAGRRDALAAAQAAALIRYALAMVTAAAVGADRAQVEHLTQEAEHCLALLDQRSADDTAAVAVPPDCASVIATLGDLRASLADMDLENSVGHVIEALKPLAKVCV